MNLNRKADSVRGCAEIAAQTQNKVALISSLSMGGGAGFRSFGLNKRIGGATHMHIDSS